MPFYIYQNTKTNELKEIFQGMKDAHVFSGDNNDEDCWKRVFTVPQASIDASIDPFSSKEFNDKTGSKKGTVGDLLDKSAELSQKRAEIAGGTDPIKQKYFKEYSEKRKGAKHFEELKQTKTFENDKVKVDFTKD